MRSVNEMDDRVIRLQERRAEIEKLSDESTLSKGFTCLERSNRALGRYIKDKKDSDMKWAELWDAGRKEMVRRGQLQSEKKFWIDEKINLDTEIQELKNKIYYATRSR